MEKYGNYVGVPVSEQYVGVASTRKNMIPENFAKTDEIYYMRFEMDQDDGTIYRRSVIITTPDNFVDTVKDNQITAFVYDSMDEDFEKALKEAGIELYPNKTGNVAKAVVSLFV